MKIKGAIVRDEPGNFADFEDPDGNGIYIWEVNREAAARTTGHEKRWPVPQGSTAAAQYLVTPNICSSCGVQEKAAAQL